jgi:hypothetical protein
MELKLVTENGSIPINIWDDFYEDNYIPVGEKQETFIYVEDKTLTSETQKACLELIFQFITKNLILEGVKIWMCFYRSKDEYPHLIGTEYEALLFERWQINMEGLTHKRLDKLIDELKQANFSFLGIPYHVYSQS